MTALSYQLYSSRLFPPLDNTLKMLAEIGYAHVEGYRALLADSADVDALDRGLKENGLTMPSCHIGLEMCEDDPAEVAQLAARFGIETAIVPYIMPADRPTTADAWRSYGARLEGAALAISRYDLKLAYHNHDFEFVPLEDGTLPIDLILESAPGLLFEYDVAWAVRAGADPMEPIAKHGPRIAIAHLKDIAPAGEAEDEDGWADVGHGTMDWPSLFQSLKAAGTRQFVMEHDNPSDHRRFAQRAFDAAQKF
ncbi:xylose isomerase [Tateyamaria omphalii]|uniref:sugar phosphate isomerase/epimerase family protein n=1 Tax=Tateyamaria omphalii TaxID=299262 RepID=UPI001679F2C0|nr:sugar phosphate isomerase/epimerase [Tateyamaria omphalii]GGX65578.1 xylose isomerase [Tateyamaria omphalii]